MLTFVRSSSSVLVMISSMAVPICNYLHARQAQSINHHFLQGYLSLTPTCAGPLESRASGLGLLKSMFNAENFIRSCLGLSPAILAQFTLEMRVAAQNCAKKFTKNPFLRGSRSFKVIDVDKSKSLSPVLVMIRSMYVPVCNRFYIIRANNGKMTSF